MTIKVKERFYLKNASKAQQRILETRLAQDIRIRPLFGRGLGGKYGLCCFLYPFIKISLVVTLGQWKLLKSG